VRRMFTADARRARSIGHLIVEARRTGDRDKELRYRRRAEAMIAEFGPNAQREIDLGRREQLRRMRSSR
jgi:hypothetical protein